MSNDTIFSTKKNDLWYESELIFSVSPVAAEN